MKNVRGSKGEIGTVIERTYNYERDLGSWEVVTIHIPIRKSRKWVITEGTKLALVPIGRHEKL